MDIYLTYLSRSWFNSDASYPENCLPEYQTFTIVKTSQTVATVLREKNAFCDLYYGKKLKGLGWHSLYILGALYASVKEGTKDGDWVRATCVFAAAFILRCITYPKKEKSSTVIETSTPLLKDKDIQGIMVVNKDFHQRSYIIMLLCSLGIGWYYRNPIKAISAVLSAVFFHSNVIVPGEVPPHNHVEPLELPQQPFSDEDFPNNHRALNFQDSHRRRKPPRIITSHHDSPTQKARTRKDSGTQTSKKTLTDRLHSALPWFFKK